MFGKDFLFIKIKLNTPLVELARDRYTRLGTYIESINMQDILNGMISIDDLINVASPSDQLLMKLFVKEHLIPVLEENSHSQLTEHVKSLGFDKPKNLLDLKITSSSSVADIKWNSNDKISEIAEDNAKIRKIDLSLNDLVNSGLKAKRVKLAPMCKACKSRDCTGHIN